MFKRFARRCWPITAVFLFGLLLTPTAVFADDDEWRARYWNNTSFEGDPALVRNEDEIDNDWGDSSPNEDVINTDSFAARWTRTINFAAGTYRFTTTGDDGMRVFLDDNEVIDVWYDSQVHTTTADVFISDGEHTIKVEYYEAGGGAIAKFNYALIGSTAPASPAPSQPAAITNWQAEYFNNENLSGTPALVRDDASIDFIWGSSSPAPNVVNNDKFSVRWTRNLSLPAGVTIFTLAADDGARLYVNDQLIIDQWQLQNVTTYSAAINLPGGSTPVRLEYYEFTGLAEARLSWSSGGSSTPTTTQPAPQTAVPGTNTAVMTGAIHLTVREGTGLDFEPVAYLSRNETVTLLGRDAFTVWVQIRRADGTVGWVSGSFLSSGVPLDSLPILN